MAPSRVPQYAQFSEGMHREYERAVQKIRARLVQGFTYDQACSTLCDLSHEMKNFVREDFLKILIAEEHFGAGVELADIALLLDIPYETVEKSKSALVRDMTIETEAHQQKTLFS